jgi:hypothetical protein
MAFFSLNVALMIAIFFADLFQCTPMRYTWASVKMEQEGKHGTCIHTVNFFLISAGLSVLLDIFILLVPAAMVYNLKMLRRKKIAVWGILSLGWL